MNNQLADSAPVTDEELDQMIWKLERDGGMTPKLLSLMRELREVRKAKCEPVAWRYRHHNGLAVSNWRYVDSVDECNSAPNYQCQPLYAAPPAPVAPAGWQLVPIEPTEGMIVDGFESAPNEDFSDPKVWAEYEAMSGCQQAAHRAKLCWAAMLKAAPQMKGDQ